MLDFGAFQNTRLSVLHRLAIMPPAPKCLPTFLDFAHPQKYSQIIHSYLLRTCFFLLVFCAVVVFGLLRKDFWISSLNLHNIGINPRIFLPKKFTRLSQASLSALIILKPFTFCYYVNLSTFHITTTSIHYNVHRKLTLS